MAEGKGRDAWGHTSSVLALTASIHRDTKKRKRPFEPAEFNPWHAGGGKGGNSDSSRAKVGTDISVDQLAREMVGISRARQRQECRAKT